MDLFAGKVTEPARMSPRLLNGPEGDILAGSSAVKVSEITRISPSLSTNKKHHLWDYNDILNIHLHYKNSERYCQARFQLTNLDASWTELALNLVITTSTHPTLPRIVEMHLKIDAELSVSWRILWQAGIFQLAMTRLRYLWSLVCGGRCGIAGKKESNHTSK